MTFPIRIWKTWDDGVDRAAKTLPLECFQDPETVEPSDIAPVERIAEFVGEEYR